MLMDTGGHAHIGRMKRGGEGMGREIQPTTFEVIAHRDQDQSAKLQLSSLIVGFMQHTVVDLNPALSDSFQQRYETGLEGRKHRPETGNSRAWFIGVQQARCRASPDSQDIPLLPA